MSCDLAPFMAHGGRVAAARRAFGGDDWIDLSTGIAPWAWPVDGVPLAFDRLPEPAALAALEAAAAAAFGVADAACVVAVPGTDLALRLLARVIDAERIAVVEPGYAGHRAAWPKADAVSAPLPGKEGGANYDLLVLASPANPNGRVTDPATLDARTIVLDEAYADPAPCPAPSDGLIVLRSFGKFYGLPGLRLGFVIADEAVARALRAHLGDWPVSSAAIAIGTAAYRDVAWREAQARRIGEGGMLLDRVLDEAGIRIVGSAPLFRLVEGGHALFRHLAARAILTRPFAAMPDRLRIGLPRGTAGIARLAAALEDRPR